LLLIFFSQAGAKIGELKGLLNSASSIKDARLWFGQLKVRAEYYEKKFTGNRFPLNENILLSNFS
jgi:hypothetical protein